MLFGLFSAKHQIVVMRLLQLCRTAFRRPCRHEIVSRKMNHPDNWIGRKPAAEGVNRNRIAGTCHQSCPGLRLFKIEIFRLFHVVLLYAVVIARAAL